MRGAQARFQGAKNRAGLSVSDRRFPGKKQSSGNGRSQEFGEVEAVDGNITVSAADIRIVGPVVDIGLLDRRARLVGARAVGGETIF